MIHKLEIVCGIVSLICGIGLVVFSCIDIPGSMLAMAIFGLVLIITALLYMYLYARSRKNYKGK